MNEVQRLMDKVIEFRDERDWAFHHNPKDLALSLSLEASELLELFQWVSSEEALETKHVEMKEELAVCAHICPCGRDRCVSGD